MASNACKDLLKSSWRKRTCGLETVLEVPAPEAGEAAPSSLRYSWEDGCLFSIRANGSHGAECYALPVLFFDAEKWRTPLAAYCLYDCSALWPEVGTWEGYSIGSEMIS